MTMTVTARTPLIEDDFLDQVRRRPDDLAVVDGRTTLTYRQLAERAATVANALSRRGVERETLVGMAFERGCDAIVAMVGIVLAGGAYVPLNPALPPRRLAGLAETAGLRILLCGDDAWGAVRAALTEDVETVPLSATLAESADARLGHLRTPPPPAGRSPLANVMFTSGSTGPPKGVMVEHRGVHRIAREPGEVRIDPKDHVLHASALEFDAATLEVWGALLNGARLCVVAASDAVVADRLAALVRQHRISFAFVTSALFNQLVDEDPTVFATLRRLFTGGDVVSPRHLNVVRKHSPDLALYSAYGPTENTVFTTVHRIDQELDGPVPIGRAVDGTTVFVLDPDRRECLDDEVGELFTGGAGVTRGYLNEPELTRERFVEIAGERYYRSGDLVHRDATGVLHFHGRNDGQVKIRGHRIEISEVTTALRAVPGVRDAHVLTTGTVAHEKHLIAYLVAPEAAEPAVRSRLAEVLPNYSIPDRLIYLDRFPLRTNGKVDVDALPRIRVRPQHAHDAARRPLAELWGAVLGIAPEAIGPDDSFLDAGGNSIKLGALISRIHRTLGVQLSFGEAARFPSLAAMAAALESAEHDSYAPIPAVPAGQPTDLHPRQLGLYTFWQIDPESLVYNVPVRARLTGRLDVERLRAAFHGLVERHDATRMRFLFARGDLRQVTGPAAAGRLDLADEPHDGIPAGFVRPFRPDRPPLLRALLVRHGPETHELFLDAHHIGMDGVSLRLLLAELFDRYAGTSPPAPATTWAAAAQWCHDRVPEAGDEAYWLGELANPPAGPALPADLPRGGSRPSRGAVARREIGAAGLTRLDDAARQSGYTAFEVTLTAYLATLARMSGQNDVVVGTPVSGRQSHPDLESVVGMFTNMVCLRARIDPETTLGGLLAQLAAKARKAITHQDVPFERLVKRLGVIRDPTRNPIFDAVFAFQDLEMYEFRTGGLEVSVDLLNIGTTRFDVNLQAYRRPDRLVLELEYAIDLFHAQTAEALLDRYLATLTALLETPSQPCLADR